MTRPAWIPYPSPWLRVVFIWSCLYTTVALGGFVLQTTPENEATVLRAIQAYDDARLASSQGHSTKAMHLYEQAIDLYAHLPGAYNNLAMLVYATTRDRDHTLAILERGASVAKEIHDTDNYAAALNNMGFIAREQHQRSVTYCLEAIKYYDRALQALPDFVDALYNKASALTAMRQLDDAEKMLLRVLALEPMHAEAHLDLGAIYFQRNMIDKAIDHEDAVIQIAKTTKSKLGAMHNKGQFLKAAGQLSEALHVHEEAVALAPEDAIALVDLVTAQRTLCKWENREQLLDRMLFAVQRSGLPSAPLLPYDSTLLPLSDSLRLQLASRHSAKYQQAATLQLLPLRDVTTDDVAGAVRPLRIGYLTYDFRDHPMGHLTLGLLDAHDPQRNEVFCYSYGPNDGSTWRHRAEKRCDAFHDGLSKSDLEFASQIATDQVDIVVDLMAHTTGARLGISALRSSSIIVNYLGYPGTLGSTFTDFVIADRVVVPPETAAFAMTEQVVYLPHTYQVNEYDLAIPFCSVHSKDNNCTKQIRLAQGLPGHGVVFCNFNTIDKMEPVSFSVWMNILRRVPTSVLWLLQAAKRHSDQIEATLRDEAQAQGIDPTRLIFAPREPKQTHLARLSVADLFLDSFVYNAHSTASDALFANVPIVTLWGDTFPSRVAGSLVTNLLGMPELVPHSIKEYEELAVHLATQQQLLHRVRKEMARRTLAAPLFDTPRTTRHIEDAYEAMHDIRHRFSSSKSIPKRFQLMVQPSQTHELTPMGNTHKRLQQANAYALQDHGQGRFLEATYTYTRILDTSPHDLDAIHLLGVALHQLGHHQKALDQLTHAVEVYNTTALFRYNHAIVLVALQRYKEAERDLFQALRLQVPYAMAFFTLTDLLLSASRFHEIMDIYQEFGHAHLGVVAAAAHEASSPPAEEAPAVHVDEKERERGYLQLSYALAQVSRTKDAIALLEHAVVAFPTLFRLGYNLAALHLTLGDHDAGDTRQIHTAQEEAKYLFATRGQAASAHKQPRPAGRRVVAIYCHEYGQSWWGSWGPSSLRKGLGGSEEAVVFMAKQLQELGYWVEVYGNPPAEDLTKTSDGQAKWYPQYTYDPDDRDVDIFIAWRYHISLAVGKHAKAKYFWVHDVPSVDTKHSRILAAKDGVDRILCVSAFQASLFPRHLAAKLVVTSNALDPASFVAQDLDGQVAKRQNTRFVYGSSPSRGLHQLLQAWPRIRMAVPDATLRVFYGFTPAFLSWGSRHIPHFDNWKRSMDTLLTQPGVQYVGLVDHETLAHEYASAGFYLYPTTYSETSCVSLMKAMANGAVPITSRFPSSALGETCDAFDLGPRALNDTVDDDPQWLELWIQSIADAVAQQQKTDALRKRMVQFARLKYQWENVALQWHTLFQKQIIDADRNP